MLDSSIKNIVLDFGGVLIDLDRRRCLEHFRRLGLPDVEGLLNDYRQQGFFLLHEKGLITDADFRNRVRNLAMGPLSDAQIDEAWNSFLAGIPVYKLDFLLELRRRYKLYLLSNTNAIHWTYACAHEFGKGGLRVEDYFDRLFLTYQMKMAKPDADIFQTMLSEAGIRPEETLFIDDAEANCKAAQALGIRTYTPKAHEDWRHLFQ